MWNNTSPTSSDKQLAWPAFRCWYTRCTELHAYTSQAAAGSDSDNSPGGKWYWQLQAVSERDNSLGSQLQGVTETDITHLAVIGSSSSPCCTSSTSTCSSVWYLRTVLEQSATQISTWLWAPNMPLDGTISNSLGAVTVDTEPSDRVELERLHRDGRWPSPGTCRWKITGTRDKLVRVQVRLDVKPAPTTHFISEAYHHLL